MTVYMSSQEINDPQPIFLESVAPILGHLSTLRPAGTLRGAGGFLLEKSHPCHSEIVPPLACLETPLVTRAQLVVQSHDVAGAVQLIASPFDILPRKLLPGCPYLSETHGVAEFKVLPELKMVLLGWRFLPRRVVSVDRARPVPLHRFHCLAQSGGIDRWGEGRKMCEVEGMGRRGEGEGTCRAAGFECSIDHRGSDCDIAQLSTHRRFLPFSQFSSDTIF